jgi:hypothetical protein
MHAACARSTAPPPFTYRRREPEKNPLYRIVKDHSEALFAEAEEAHPESGGYPQYIKDEVQAFLDCGIMSRG